MASVGTQHYAQGDGQHSRWYAMVLCLLVTGAGLGTTMAPGTVVLLKVGDRTTWVIYETLRKVYVALPQVVST